MASYISRRKRWYQKLKDIDNTYEIPDKLLSDMLLDNSGLTEDQQLMVTNAVKPNVDFDSVAAEIRDQHPLIHERDARRSEQYSGRDRENRHTFPLDAKRN